MKIEDIHVSGSEVAALLGLSKWDSPMDIYMKKLGLTEPKPENEAMRWGSAAEHVVARRYVKETGFALRPEVDTGYDRFNPLIHPDFPWWTGTPDREIITPKDNGLLEIKVIGERSAAFWGEPPDGEIPDEYLCQMAWYFPLINAEWGDLAVQIGNKEFRIYRVKRDRELETTMRDAALDFINNHLIPEIPPPIDASESSKQFLAYKYPKEEKEDMVAASDEIETWANMLAVANFKIKQNEELKQLYENLLKDKIQEHRGIESPRGWKVTWTKNKDSQKTDWEACFKEWSALDPTLSGIVKEKYTFIKPGTRVFRASLKPLEEELDNG